MAKRGRPAQGNNSNKKLVKLRAGGTNDRILKTRNPHNSKRRAT
jgi:hypothetical protein